MGKIDENVLVMVGLYFYLYVLMLPPSCVNHQAWVWNLQRLTPQTLECIQHLDTVYLLQGDFNKKNNHITFHKQGIGARFIGASHVYLTFRFWTVFHNKYVFEKMLFLIHEFEARGTTIQGIQIDFDAPTLKLSNYVLFLTSLKKVLPSQYKLSITGLLDWSRYATSQDFHALYQVVDEIVFQTYQGRCSISNMYDFILRLQSISYPFKLGVLKQSKRDVENHHVDVLNTNPFFHGYVEFEIK